MFAPVQFIQPASLNKFVDPTIPLTWRKRWELVKPILPLLVVSGILSAEILAFRLWRDGKNLLANFPLILLATTVPAIGGLAAAELTLRIDHWTKRRLKLGPRKVQISHARFGNLPWRWVKRWLLEPVPGEAQLTELTLEYAIDKKGKRVRTWSIVLTDPEQTQTLKSELGYLRERGITTAPLVELSEPIFRPQMKTRIPGMLRLTLALFFFVHGVALFSAAVGPNENADRPRSASHFTEHAEEARGQATAGNFASKKQFRRFCIRTGVLLIALSAAFYVWAWTADRRARKSSQGEVPASNGTP